MDVIRGPEQKIQHTEEKIAGGLGKDVHMFEKLYGDEHDNPHEFRNEQESYQISDQKSI
jgi:hypothetical protein